MSARQIVFLAILGIVSLIGFILLKKIIKLAFIAIVIAAVIGIGYMIAKKLL
ncbi:MAG: hypothetical protein NZ519_10470 [Bacteroidia bacterium]|nr:hypothetical protein [Bacteroidia bacterium]MDW8302478.1 hypothetical protein [Bacteroidia bacterium]